RCRVHGLQGHALHPRCGGALRRLADRSPQRRSRCLVDADWLTIRRTAATAAVATDLLASPRVRDMGLLGSSEQARALLSALSRVRAPARVKVYSPNPAHREHFAQDMGQQLDLPIIPVDSAEAAAGGSDLVAVAIRPGSTPVLFADWLAPGAHVT